MLLIVLVPDLACPENASVGLTVTLAYSAEKRRPNRDGPLRDFVFFLLILGERGNSQARKQPRLGNHQAGLGREGDAMPASRTARIPVRKIPSNVPAPPIEATGAPRLPILSRLRRSAPISVPIEPPI